MINTPIPSCKIIFDPWFHHLYGNVGATVDTAMKNTFRCHHLELMLSTIFQGPQVLTFFETNVYAILVLMGFLMGCFYGFLILVHDIRHLFYVSSSLRCIPLASSR